jgi:predicted ATPase
MPGFIQRAFLNPRKNIDRGEFPLTLHVFRGFEGIEFHPQVTFFVGDNGSGKSTLLEAVAVNYGFSAEGGTKGHSFRTMDTHSGLHENLILAKMDYPRDALFLRAETFYNMASYVKEAGGSRFGHLHEMSHGEGFLEAIGTLNPPGLYLMDEPESALSPVGQLSFLVQMKRLVDGGGQFIIATHSPILLGFGRGWIYEFSENGMNRVDYRETTPYLITQDFLKNRGRYVELLGLDPD